MRSLVTGGAGFIGSHIVEALIREGGEVVVLDNLSTGCERNLEDIAQGFDFHKGDVRNGRDLERAVDGARAVFHLAAQVSVPLSVSDPVLTYEVNAVGTARLLEACVKAGVRRVVLSSSCAVYGDDEALPKSEDMTPQPLSAYAATKVTGEHLMSVYDRLHDLETLSLRYFNVFGPRQDPASEYAAVIPKFIQRMGAGGNPVFFGDGRQTRDFIYVSNVVDANLAAARCAEPGGRVLNIGSGESIDLVRLVEVLNEVLGTNLEPTHEPPRPGDILHSRASTGEARRVLGWEPRVGLAEGLEKTAAWFRRE
jgi:UDP-glucose 4-epimerase